MDLTVPGLTLPVEITDPDWVEQKGRKVYRTNPVYRDIATFMEHPESYQFYQKYLTHPDRFQKMMTCLKIYDTISNYMNSDLNAYHKIFILYNLLKYTNMDKLKYIKAETPE